MPLTLPVDAEDVLDALFLSVMSFAGFLGGGLIGLAIGFAAGYAYITWTDRIADLEATVNALIKEKETLRQRVDELEADDGCGDGGHGDGVTDGGHGDGAADTADGEDVRPTDGRSR